jgi:hypothetical protein
MRRQDAAPAMPLRPGMHIDASDRTYITDTNPGTLRLLGGKVRGKAARRADKTRRRLERERQARAVTG